MLVKKCGQDMKATTLNNCNKRQQSAKWRRVQGQEKQRGGPCRVAGHKQIGRCTAADADMSSTCRSRRSTKSIPGILLPRSCLAQSVAAQRHRGRQRVQQKADGGQANSVERCSDWSAAVYGLMQPIQMQLLRSSRSCSWSLSLFLSRGPGNTHSRRPLTMDPKPRPRAEPESESELESTHTASWKLENYFHCWTGGGAAGGSGRLWLRLVSKRHKRVLY